MQAARKTILVVEDERVVALDIQRSLIDLGYEVPATAASAEEAISLASKRCPDLVLMDIRIKGDRDGIETAGILRERFGVPVIYLTAYADTETLNRAKVTEPYGYLLKPIKSNELGSIVEVALYKHEVNARLREREEWLSTTLRSIGDGVIAVGADRRVTLMNPIAEHLTGWKAEEATGRPVDEVFRIVNETTRAHVENPLERALREGTVIQLANHAVLLPRTGGEIPIDDSAAPIADGKGKVLGAILVFRDIRERRKLEARLLFTDRMASVGMLAAGVGHEINNPLSYIIANREFLADGLRKLASTIPSNALSEMEEVLGEARQGAERVRKIVRELRTFARADKEQLTVLQLQPVLELAVNMTFNEIRHRARLVKDYAEMPLVEADESRLAQVFINVLINAAQSIPDGQSDRNEIRLVGRTDPSGRAVVEVRDTGRGIAPENIGRIFDPFYTTKPIGEGTGLGLSISHSIVTGLGGEITVESEVGKGTVCRVVLPPGELHLEGASSTRAQTAVARVQSGRRARVLVVDDDEAVGRSLQRVLVPEHDVVVLTSGTEALSRIRSGECFDAILCDLMMPILSGMELHREIRKAAPDQSKRIIFITGGAFTPAARDFLDQVENARFAKPFDTQNLRAFVRSMVAA